MGQVIQFVIDGIIDCFQHLSEFEFLGTNMLKFSLTIMLIGVVIPIIFTIPIGHNISGALEKSQNKPREKSARERAREFGITARRSDKYK